MQDRPILVIGATGYVGGRLVPLLLDAGYRVRALGRSREKMKSRPWSSHPLLELARGDVQEAESLRHAAQGCGVAFYLVHSMTSASQDFARADRTAAHNLVQAAAEANLERLIYLGGLGEADDPRLSEHLRSRFEVARILSAGPVPATVLRAAMILGSGGAAFEILRYLVDRLPVMLTPRWVFTPVQPIAIRNVLGYLLGCVAPETVKGQTFDIGGPEIVTYRQLMDIYAQEANLPPRAIVSVPVLTPRLSAYWIHFITPVPASLAQPLAEGLAIPVVCRDNRIRDLIPQELLDCRQAIRLALQRVEQQRVETCWSDAGLLVPPEWASCGDAPYTGGTVLRLGYRIVLAATSPEAWEPLARIGGTTGWYYGKTLWTIRGWIDRLLGGSGLRRGRRQSAEIRTGDALDFFRVLEIEPERRLLLLAEMKMPGEATLEFRIKPRPDGNTELTQTARFLPRGLSGIAYWYVLDPFHKYLYRGMLKAIAAATGKPVVKGPEWVKD